MRVIITGGTGLVGTALSTYLVEKGYEVVTLSRSPNQAAAPAGVRPSRTAMRGGVSSADEALDLTPPPPPRPPTHAAPTVL